MRKFGIVVSALILFGLSTMTGLAYGASYSYRTATVSANNIQSQFDFYGSQGWLFKGEEEDQVIFEQHGKKVIYQLVHIGHILNAQSFLDQKGAGGWYYLGELHDYIIFNKVDFPVTYMATGFKYTNLAEIPGKMQYFAQQGYKFLDEEQGVSIFVQTGAPFYTYSVRITEAEKRNLQAEISALGGNGWLYLGDVEDYNIFMLTGENIPYLVLHENSVGANYQGHLNAHGPNGWRYITTNEDHLIFRK